MKLWGIFLDKREDLDARKVCAVSLEQWELSGVGIGMRRDNDDATTGGCRAIGQTGAAGDVGGELKSEQALVVVAIEQCGGGTRKPVWPEPTDGLGLGLRERAVVNGKGNG